MRYAASMGSMQHYSMCVQYVYIHMYVYIYIYIYIYYVYIYVYHTILHISIHSTLHIYILYMFEREGDTLGYHIVHMYHRQLTI